ncbi:MAG: gliding motility lipoprotein GldH [Paludibacter sp.]
MARKILKNSLIIAFATLILNGCVKSDVYLKYKTITTSGWHKDSLCTFDIPVNDTTIRYNIYVNVRNRGEYPYQNLWLFLSKMTPGSVETKDSIECYLADKRGKWLGTGIGSVLQMPVLYQQNVKFEKKGIYKYKIVHGMRDTVLVGINDIGMQVEKISQ